LLELSDNEIQAIALAELQSYLPTTANPIKVWIRRWHKAMPLYKVSHDNLLKKIDKLLQKQQGIALAGSSYQGVGIPDCIYSGKCAAENISLFLQNRCVVN